MSGAISGGGDGDGRDTVSSDLEAVTQDPLKAELGQTAQPTADAALHFKPPLLPPSDLPAKKDLPGPASQLQTPGRTGSSDVIQQPPAAMAHGADKPAILRGDLIQKAVEFLLSQPVLSSARPLKEKMDFLGRKGLTADEVAEAVRRANASSVGGSAAAADAGAGRLPMATMAPPQLPLRPQQATTPPLPARVARLAFTAAAVGAVAYGAYHLYSAYIKPYAQSKLDRRSKGSARDESESALPAAVEQMLGRLSESVAQLSRSVVEQQLLLQQLSARLDGQKIADAKCACDLSYRLLQYFAVSYREDRLTASPTSSVEELKSEIQSVKRLLLSKHQFPPAPVTSPVLPAWQMDDSKDASANAANPAAPASAVANTSIDITVSGQAVPSGTTPSGTTAGLPSSSAAFVMNGSSFGDGLGAGTDHVEQSCSDSTGADASPAVAKSV